MITNVVWENSCIPHHHVREIEIELHVSDKDRFPATVLPMVNDVGDERFESQCMQYVIPVVMISNESRLFEIGGIVMG